MVLSTHIADQISLSSPMLGDFLTLDQVPDPAFSQKLVGDGVAIDPVDGRLYAPCAGVVTLIHPSHHAISLKTDDEIEVLMHIGIDTVKLKGKGFNVQVKEGQRVSAGDLLIMFDLDYVAQHAVSMVTPILITNLEQVTNLFLPSQIS